MHDLGAVLPKVESDGVAQAMILARELSRGSASLHARLAYRAFLRLIANGVIASSLPAAQQQLAEQTCREIMSHSFWSRAELRNREIGINRDEFRSYAARLMDKLNSDIATIAMQLVIDPSGRSLRTPRSPRRSQRAVVDVLRDVVT